MKIYFATAGIILTVLLSNQLTAYASMAVREDEYVRFADFIAIVEQKLSAETADGLRKQFKDKSYVDFREAEYNASIFSEKQFSGQFTVKRFYEALLKDDVLVKGKSVSDLNELIKSAGLYEQVRRKHFDKVESEGFKTNKQAYDNLKCEADQAQLNNGNAIKKISYNAKCQTGLGKFNRAILEEYYSKECPKLPAKEFMSIGEFFFSNALMPYLERNEIEKVKQFLQALNEKKVIFGYRIFARGNSGCYVLDYSLENNSDPSNARGIYIVAAKKPYNEGVCKGDSASNPVTFRMRIK